MMDDNNCKHVNSDSNTDVDDWLAELKSDIQPEVGNTGIEDTRFQVSSLNPRDLSQLDNFSVNLEEKLCQDAASKSDFMSRTCQKMMPMESLCYHCSSAASSSSALTQTARTEAAGHGSTLQNISAYSHELVGNQDGQNMQSSIFANTQRELTRTQPMQQVVPQRQHQQLWQQLLKQKVQQPNIQHSSMQSNIQYSHHQQLEQHILSLPTEIQSSQQSMFTAVQDQRQIGKHPNATILQQNHRLGLLEKQQKIPLYQQNMSTTFKQSLGLQNNVSRLNQQQFIGARSNKLKVQPHQHALHILQQPEIAAAQQNVQQKSQHMQLHQLMGLQNLSNSLQEGMQKRHQTSVALLSQNGIIDQKKQLEQSQRVLPEASSVASVGSTCWIEGASLADWHNQAYQELESMREMYLPDVIKLYKRANDLCLQSPSAELATKYEKTRIFIEKTMKFLQMPRADIVHCSKDKFYHYLKLISVYLNSVRSKNPVSAQQYGQQLQAPGSLSQIPQLQQQMNMKLQFHPVNPGLKSAPAGPPQLSVQQGIPNSQANKINLVHNGSLTDSEPKYAPSPLQHGSIHQYTVSRLQQTNIISSLHNGTLNTMEQRNAPYPMRHGSVRSLHPSTLSSPQQTNFSHMNTVNALDPTTGSLPSSSTVPFLNLKQQPKHQMMQAHTLKQPMQQPLIEQKKQQMFMQKIHEVNEPKMGQVIGFSSGMLQQHHLIGPHTEYSPQSLLPSTPHLYDGSPQTSQHSSPHIDQKNLLSPLSKAGTSSQSAASPFIVPSPSTPLTPSSLPMDPEKHSSGISPLLVAENAEHPQTPVAQIQSQATSQNQFLAIGTPEILASPLLTEFTSPEDNQQTNAKEPSLKCLLEVVETISPRALRASVLDIGSVINMIDRIAGTTAGSESRVAIGDDLAVETSHHLQGRNLTWNCGSSSSKRMKCHISTTASDSLSAPLNENDGLERLSCQIPDTESTATSRIKRPRTEPNDALLDEIKGINNKLVETVVDVVSDSTEDAAKAGFGEATIVRCSYSTVGFDGNFKQQYASSRMLSILPVRLLVPADYPNSSPILLNTSSIGWSEAGELENLSERAKSRFRLSLRKLPQPMSLGEMARAWEFCARTVLSELAQSSGGGSFSSTYGTWENYITAA